MPLSNKQKLKIINVAKENGYQGDYVELFNQAEEEQIFNTKEKIKAKGTPEFAKENNTKSEASNKDIASDYNLDVDALLVDNTRHSFSNKELTTNAAHERTPMPSALLSFLENPAYKREPNQPVNPTQTKIKSDGGMEIPDDSKLSIVSPKGDPWEYSKSGDGNIITRKKSVGTNSAGNWIQTKEGTRAHSAIVDTILKPTAIHKSSVDLHINTPNPTSIDQLTVEQENKISKAKIEDPFNTDNKIDSELYKQMNIRGSNTSQIQQMLVDNKYDLGQTGASGNGVDGDWGSITDAAFKQWSDDNLNNLSTYQGQRTSICVQGKACSEKVTNMLGQLFPQVDRNDFGPDDAWYRKEHVMELGGKEIWSTTTAEARGDWDNLPDLPPIDLWKDFRVGDLVHLNRKGNDRGEEQSAMGYGIEQNRGTEHAGFIIGKDDNGMPLLMHKTNGTDMSVQRIDEIYLNNGNRYKIDAVTRPKGMLDNPVINKDHYIFNKNKSDLISSNREFTDNPTKSADYFASMFEGVINTDIDRLASTTGNSREQVLEAARLGYGIFKTETGDWKGILAGKSKEIIKSVANPEVVAAVRTGVNQAKNIFNTGKLKTEGDKDGKLSMWDYILPAITGNPVDLYRDISLVEADYSEKSSGASRIKFDTQTKNQDGSQTTVGSWYEKMGIDESSISWYNPEATKNSFNAVTLQVLDYTRKIKKHKEYDPKTNTLAGVPLQYAIATMHKSPNLYGRVDKDHSVLDYLKLGDRDYSNSVINSSKDMSIDYHDEGTGSGEFEKAVEFSQKKKTK